MENQPIIFSQEKNQKLNLRFLKNEHIQARNHKPAEKRAEA